MWPNEGFAADFSFERLQGEKSLTLGSIEGEIDVFDRIDGIGGYSDVLAASQPVRLAGPEIRVITLEGLIRSKRASNRPKDALHLPDLECIRELRNRSPIAESPKDDEPPSGT